MASGITNFLGNALLNNIFRATAYTMPATIYVGLFTATPSDSAAGTEVTGGSYARQSLTSNTTNFTPAASGGSIANGSGIIVTFPTATASWGTVTQYGLFDASTAGNLLFWADLTASKTVGNGDVASFAGSSITISLA